jgi:hypothetical protein
MKANELKIGNIVTLTGDTWTEDVRDKKHTITAQDILDIEGGAEGYEAIPVTAALLESLGFSSGRSHGFYFTIKGVTGFTMARRAGRFYLKEYKVDANPIRTLHHLQNLFYDIKGEELNVG